MMVKTIRKSGLIVAGALMCIAPSAFAQCPGGPPPAGSACMDLYSAGSNVMGDIYVGPYYALINGVSTAVICDDFGDESFLPETWTADIFTPPNYVVAPGTASVDATRNAIKWGMTAPSSAAQLALDYDAVGWLSTEMLANLGNSVTEGEIDYALWNVFDPSALPYLQSFYAGSQCMGGSTPCYYQGAVNWYNLAMTAASTDPTKTAYISGYTIYSPDTSLPISSPGGPNNPPQEFLVYTPEPPALAILVLDLSGFAGLVYLLRRRVFRSSR